MKHWRVVLTMDSPNINTLEEFILENLLNCLGVCENISIEDIEELPTKDKF